MARIETKWITPNGLATALRDAGVPCNCDDNCVELGAEEDLCSGSPHAMPEEPGEYKRWVMFLPDGRSSSLDVDELVTYAVAWAAADEVVREQLLAMGKEADEARDVVIARNADLADKLLGFE